MQSLYVHFPFCESKCHYCDFYSLGKEKTRPGDSDRFEKALFLEASRLAEKLSPELQTIFFGGGTPSMTHCDSMTRALAPLWEKTKVTSETEWTLEANPSSIDKASMEAYRKLGVNRISMGVQALQPELLKDLGRVHSREDVFLALENVFAAGIENVSVDLLCGVPGQSEADLEKSLDTLTRYPISHLSCYLLTLPPHHRMYPSLPDEETQLKHLLLIHDWMTARGFEHYEISNFALPGKRARHNLNYWQGKSYLGLGPSAHSYDAQTFQRWKNVSSLHKYAQLLDQGESVLEWTETLTPEQIKLEQWMLALRLDEGFPETWLKTPLQKERTRIFQKEGLLESHPQKNAYFRLTARGFALSDQVIRALS